MICGPFPDRTVLIAKGIAKQMRRSVELLNCIAELRKAKDTPEFFIQMSPKEQAEWGKDALERMQPSLTDDVAICILDTGITKENEPDFTGYFSCYDASGIKYEIFRIKNTASLVLFCYCHFYVVNDFNF